VLKNFFIPFLNVFTSPLVVQGIIAFAGQFPQTPPPQLKGASFAPDCVAMVLQIQIGHRHFYPDSRA
jgi:hypothetical protein